MICPKCGFDQPDGGLDCVRCGIVFGRYHGPQAPAAGAGGGGGGVGGAGGVRGVASRGAAGGEQLYEGPPVGGDVAPAGLAMRPAPVIFTRVPAFDWHQVMQDTFRILGSNLLAFVLIAGVALVPVMALSLLAAQALDRSRPDLAPALFALGSNLFATPLATGAVVYGVAQELRRRQVTMLECLSAGLSRMPAVLGVALLQGIVIGLGFVCCIVPGLIAAAVLALSVPAAVEERPGVFNSLRRSAELTDGRRWGVFAVLFTLWAIGMVLSLLVRLASGAPPHAVLTARAGAGIVSSTLIGLAMTALQATAAAVMYYRLRGVQEGVGMTSLTSVFDAPSGGLP